MNDMLDFSSVVIMDSPDVRGWPATARITSLKLTPDNVRVDFTKRTGPDEWPDHIYPGWQGPLVFTLWIVLNINGVWYASGCIEFWRDRDGVGGPLSNARKDWYYAADRWGVMASHQPAPGELVGFLVTAGDARNNGPTILQERSNVVTITVPAGDTGDFSFPDVVAPPPPPPPPPVVTPPPPPVVTPPPVNPPPAGLPTTHDDVELLVQTIDNFEHALAAFQDTLRQAIDKATDIQKTGIKVHF